MKSSPTYESQDEGDDSSANSITFTPFSRNTGSTKNCALNENVNMGNWSRNAPLAGSTERHNFMSNCDRIHEHPDGESHSLNSPSDVDGGEDDEYYPDVDEVEEDMDFNESGFELSQYIDILKDRNMDCSGTCKDGNSYAPVGKDSRKD